MSSTDALDDGRALLRRLFANDAAKVATMFLGIWALFFLLSTQLNYPPDGIFSTIRRVTFLSAVFALATLALNLHWGYAGLFNIGVIGFMAVGAYTMVMLSAPTSGTPPGLGLPVAVGVAGGVVAATIVGLVAALPALRLRADYLAIVTVAISEIIRITFNAPAFADVTGAASGFGNLPVNPINTLLLTEPGSVISDPTPLGQILFDLGAMAELRRLTVINTVYTVATLVVLGLVYLLLERTGRSPFGRVLKAIREDEVATRSLGKDTRSFKLRAFALGCALMGLAGILWYTMGPRAQVRPQVFRPEQTFYIFIALIIGGAGSNTGSVLGGALFASLLVEAPPLLRDLIQKLFDVSGNPANLVEALVPVANGNLGPLAAFLLTNIDTLRFVFVGVLLVILVQRRPEGLLGDRKETASTVNLGRRPGSGPGDRATAADGGGGETDE